MWTELDNVCDDRVRVSAPKMIARARYIELVVATMLLFMCATTNSRMFARRKQSMSFARFHVIFYVPRYSLPYRDFVECSIHFQVFSCSLATSVRHLNDDKRHEWDDNSHEWVYSDGSNHEANILNENHKRNCFIIKYTNFFTCCEIHDLLHC